MNRRTFLTTLTTAAAGFALDPERLLWVPGQKTIFLPPWEPVRAIPVVGGITPATFIFWRNFKGDPLDYIRLEAEEASAAWRRWDDAVMLIANEILVTK